MDTGQNAEELTTRIGRNVSEIRMKMEAACDRAGRPCDAARLVAVTKYVGVDEVKALLDLGISDFGENRLPSASEKIATFKERDVCWHMIGNVQRRKAKDVVALFNRVDAVDRPELGEALQKRCEELDRHIAVLAEINVSGEESKHGAAFDTADALIEALRSYDRLRLDGLLCMAPFDAEEVELRKIFQRLRGLAESHSLTELSMGMSGDFEIAIEEGATEVRIGQALFK